MIYRGYIFDRLVLSKVEGMGPSIGERKSSLIIEMALERLGLPANACLMVGDRLETDIVMGRRAGMSTALVLSGVTRREDLAHSSIQPDYVLESIADLRDPKGF